MVHLSVVAHRAQSLSFVCGGTWRLSPGDRLLVLGFFLPCISRRINVMYSPVTLTAQKRGAVPLLWCSGFVLIIL